MEIADAFIINKADRADADLFTHNLKKIIRQIRDLVKSTREQETAKASLTEIELKINSEIKQTETRLENIESAVTRIDNDLNHLTATANDLSSKSAALLDQYQLNFEYATGIKILQQLKERSPLILRQLAAQLIHAG